MGNRGDVAQPLACGQPQAYGRSASGPTIESEGRLPGFAELQAGLARAYLSGNGAEVERLLALVTEADYVLPPKTDRAA
jgi:hypothetical protein